MYTFVPFVLVLVGRIVSALISILVLFCSCLISLITLITLINIITRVVEFKKELNG